MNSAHGQIVTIIMGLREYIETFFLTQNYIEICVVNVSKI
jgi:hypothetical protein